MDRFAESPLAFSHRTVSGGYLESLEPSRAPRLDEFVCGCGRSRVDRCSSLELPESGSMAHRLRAVAVNPVGGACLRPLSREIPGSMRPRGRALDPPPSAALPPLARPHFPSCPPHSSVL